ncbi:HAD family hydrolase [Dyella flava]|uniref:phosphoglycolate phosphatase n=1 Tax=Dyella flava TaxID=1920170 RepID=A0ABS2JY90_9GAMM|nr:HAD-IA family hydrolase [Dyella flava]MBM7123967.1 HAD-IA family hydrolase [Dyella flava]
MPISERIAIFDLDGTLIDAVPDIVSAINHVMDDYKLPPVSLAEAASLMGDGLRQFALRVFQRRGLTAGEDDIATFIEHYSRHPVIRTKLYPDVADTLNALADAGWRLIVCSNKKEALADRILDQLGIRSYFAVVCGGDTVVAHKPDPSHLAEALSRANGKADQAVMIGDYQADIWPARILGIPSIFASWGYGRQEMGDQATRIAERFKDLPALLDEVRPAVAASAEP